MKCPAGGAGRQDAPPLYRARGFGDGGLKMTSLAMMLTLALSWALSAPARAALPQERPPLNGYAIQVAYGGGPPGLSPMSGPELKGRFGFSIPPEMIVKRADEDGEQVSMVWVAASFEGGAWRVRVSVVKGEFYDRGEQEVAAYVVRENEKVRVREVGRFGLDPFDVSIVRVVQAAAAQPAVRNKTESVEVLSVEAGLVPSPYRLALSNRSHKPVLALEVRTYSGDQMLLLKWPAGTWDRPLMGAGGTCEVEMPSAGRGQTKAHGYVPEQSTSVEVSTVVFEDGSYEGEPYLAAVTGAEMSGSRTQLGRVVRLLRTAREAAEDDTAGALPGLKEEVSRLGEDAGAAQLNTLHGQYPTLSADARPNLVNFTRFGLHKVKTTLLKDIEAFEREPRPPGGEALRGWLSKTRERYERWLSALSR